jgi:hypothetical protein
MVEAQVPTPAPALTLSLGGVDFTLTPEDSTGSVNLCRREDGEVRLQLSCFSGSLRVHLAPHSCDSPRQVMLLGHEKEKEEEKETEIARITPRAGNSTKKKRDLEHSRLTEVAAKSSDNKRSRQEQYAEDESYAHALHQSFMFHSHHDETQTLLGQPDLSQLTGTEGEPIGPSDNNSTNSSLAPSGQVSQKDDDTEERSLSSFVLNVVHHNSDIQAHRCTTNSTQLSRPHQQEPPAPRWGHTMTPIASNRVLVYGGQSLDHHDNDSTLNTTRNDVHIFDTVLQQWSQPFNCKGQPRQWHTCTYLPERQLLISFGGEANGTTSSQAAATTDQVVMVLDTELMLWYPPTMSGTVPPGRSGHTATLLSATNELVVFGGVKGKRKKQWLNSVSVLDTMRWKWTPIKAVGSAPQPRSYHTATAVGDTIVVFGGNNDTHSFNSLHVLERETMATSSSGEPTTLWRWSNIQASGCAPAPRTGHIATLLSNGTTILFHGGWDPNDDDGDEVTSGSRSQPDLNIFDDSYLLDTRKWEWTRGPGSRSKRVGHSAMLVVLDETANSKKNKEEVILFGGRRLPDNVLAADFESLLMMV